MRRQLFEGDVGPVAAEVDTAVFCPVQGRGEDWLRAAQLPSQLWKFAHLQILSCNQYRKADSPVS